jgi:mannosyl-3-phosphoglycerate phosphatase
MSPLTVVFTDLDGSLLDHDTYSYEAALPALERLHTLHVPVVFVTSKTFEEVVLLRNKIGNRSPFVVENGAAVFAPKGNPPLPSGRIQQRESYDMVELGIPYGQLTRALKGAARESGCRIRGFADMTASEISRDCDLTPEQAVLAKARQYDEPFKVLKGNPETLLRALEKRGLRLTRGGRFFHVTGHNGKADAVLLLIEAYRKIGPIRSIGLGDGLNDTGFLNLVDYPVVLSSPFIDQIQKRVPRARIHAEGPGGWNAAVLEILESSAA